MKTQSLVLLILLPLAGCAWHAGSSSVPLPGKPGFDMYVVEKGRQLVLANECNDCHTRGYLADGDRIPLDDWLTGDSFGWHGPWGVSYASNLRLSISGMGQDEWVGMAKHLKARPLMPWSTLNEMSTGELAAIYQFVRYLGPKGEPVPATVKQPGG